MRGPFEAPHPVARLLESRIAGSPPAFPPSGVELAERHRALYDEVPGFECEPGCTACCGAVAMTAWEWEGVIEKRYAAASCLSCPYAVGGNCAIHANRPLICRLFGAVEHPHLTCPKGRGAARKLSAARARELMDAHRQLMLDSAAAERAAGAD